MEMEAVTKGIVCVTGGTGFIASWLIKKLLEHDYCVRTTVRSYPDIKRDLSFLTNLPGAQQNLEIFNADLAYPESFKPVIPGCVGVFHVAHPIDLDDKEPKHIQAKRSVDAALAIMQACVDSKSVKKFVYISSAATVAFVGDKGVEIVDENDWSDIEYLQSSDIFGSSYMISKVLTEKAVIEFAQTHGLDFVSIIPSVVNGPFICPHLTNSIYNLLAMILGKKDRFMQVARTWMVHVDDLCMACIFLFEKTNANGRYICSALDVTVEKLAEFLAARYPEYPIPTPEALRESEWIVCPRLSSKKLVDSGFKYQYGLEEMYDEAIQSCKEKGFL